MLQKLHKNAKTNYHIREYIKSTNKPLSDLKEKSIRLIRYADNTRFSTEPSSLTIHGLMAWLNALIKRLKPT